jgi:hypothetical protein
VGDRVKRHLRPAAAVLLWTIALGATVRGVDRWLVAPPPTSDWVQAAELADVPIAAPRPAYLPPRLVWPPRRIHYHVRRGDVWIGIDAGGEPLLWIGTGAAPLAMGAAAGCVGDPGGQTCAPGWRALSRALPDRRALVVVTSLEPFEARRVLEGLSLSPPH